MDVQCLDLDGSLAPQEALDAFRTTATTPARDWGPRIRLACGFAEFAKFQTWLHETLPARPAITLFGSGDFHHVTLALLNRIQEPFNLLVLDKHPDWMRGIPVMHCGTWLRHALRLPNVQRVFHCGGELDFDNAYRWLAPWADIESGRLVAFPANRRFTRGQWNRVPTQPLQNSGKTVAELLEPYRADLARLPLYISIDKDVLIASDAAVNWDSGLLTLADAVAVVEAFRTAAGGLIGADLLGDWSPVKLGHWLNRFCHWLDHPSPPHTIETATATNARANGALLQALGAAITHQRARLGGV